MGITNGYATLNQACERLDIQSASQDDNLEMMIEAASRQIDGWCSRTFYAETSTRVVSAEFPGELLLDRDLIAVDGIATDEDGDRVYEVAWDVSDIEFVGQPPFQRIYLRPASNRRFPIGRNTVQVTGTWGYAATVPHAIREACLLLVGRLYKRRDAPFGVAGSNEHGQVQTISSIDPDVKQLILPYRRFGLVGV